MAARAQQPGNQLVKINLGCGSRSEQGWVNVDIVNLPGVDICWDLDHVPWPFEDESAEEIKAEDVFEHVTDPIAFMLQCWRVLRPNGHLRLRTSYWKSKNAFTDPTHKRFCTEQTFDYWCEGTDFFNRYWDAYSRGTGASFQKAEWWLDGEELVMDLIRLPWRMTIARS